MTLEQYALLAEIVGTVTVVVSLVYLAVQVRQGIAQGQAEARYAFVQSTSDINMTIAQDKQLASVWRRDGSVAIVRRASHEYFLRTGRSRGFRCPPGVGQTPMNA
jgi:hypothetical protein